MLQPPFGGQTATPSTQVSHQLVRLSHSAGRGNLRDGWVGSSLQPGVSGGALPADGAFRSRNCSDGGGGRLHAKNDRKQQVA